jgi:two-component sensor histidine kinase
MTLIHALLGMAMRRTGDPDAAKLFRASRSRVRVIAAFHSMRWGEDDESPVDPGAYFRELVHEVERQWATHGRIRVERDTDGVRLGLAEVVPVGLCLNELVRNALEHGFPDERSGVVRVSLTASEGSGVLLRVTDDGVGFSPEASDATSGLGLSLVRLLAEQLSARLDLESSANRGTECCLRFQSTEESRAWQTS